MDLQSGEEYSVNWKNHISFVRKTFVHLLNSNELTDVTLCCEGRKIGAHKILLSACSSFFRETFMTIPCQHPVIILYGVEYDILLDILHFMYNGEVKIEPSKLDSFLKVAQNLQISGLKSGNTYDYENKEQIKNKSDESLEAEKDDEEETSTDKIHEELISSNCTAKKSKRSKLKEHDFVKEKIQKLDMDVYPASIKYEPLEINDEHDTSTEQTDYYEDESSEVLDFDDSMQQSTQITKNDLENVSTEIYLEDNKDFEVSNISGSSLSWKARLNYESTYERFLKWCDENQNSENAHDEAVLLIYFNHLSTIKKPSSLWAYFSELRTIINIKKNIDIKNYTQLRKFLKTVSKGYKAKKTKALTREEVIRFLREAHDDRYLMMKVALIIGIRGSCFREELTNLLTDNVIDEGIVFRLLIPNARTKVIRECFIPSGSTFHSLDMVEILRKYIALRPSYVDHKRFFLSYRNGKCLKQPVGINTLGAIPKIIAAYLKLPNPEDYTSLCFRKSSNALLSTM